MNIAYIRLTDWGVCFDGEHYSCDVWYDMNSTDIKHEISQGQAGRMNKKDGTKSNRPGDDSYRFETKKSAIEAAVKYCGTNFPKVKLILVGNPAWADPMPVAWAADPYVKATLDEINEVYQGVEDLSGEYNDMLIRWDNCIAVNKLNG